VTVSVLNADSGRLPPAVRTTTTAFDVRSLGFFCGRPGGLELVIAKLHYTDPTAPGSPTKSAHVVGYELNSTTLTRTDFVGDPHGPNGVSPQKKSVRVRAGPVGSVSGLCSGI